MREKKGKKKKVRLKGLLVVILIVYLIGTCLFYLWKTPVKKINIEGNYYLKDNYIIDYLDISNKSVFKINSNKLKKKLLNLDLISDVKIKKNIFGNLDIEVIEDKILFYNWNNKQIVLSSGNTIVYNKDYLGIPSLINYVPDTIYQEFVQKLSTIDKETISYISEIEYSPSKYKDEISNGTYEEKIGDDKRFIFRMNDGNIVYVNTINLGKFNGYLSIYEKIISKYGNVTGCLLLDSDSANVNFNKNCDSNSLVKEGDGNKN